MLVLAAPAAALELRRALDLDLWVEWLPVEPAPRLALNPGARRDGLLDQVALTVEVLHAAGLTVIVDLPARD